MAWKERLGHQEIQCPVYHVGEGKNEVSAKIAWRGGFAWVGNDEGTMDTDVDILMGQEVEVIVHLVRDRELGREIPWEHQCHTMPSSWNQVIQRHEGWREVGWVLQPATINFPPAPHTFSSLARCWRGKASLVPRSPRFQGGISILKRYPTAELRSLDIMIWIKPGDSENVDEYTVQRIIEDALILGIEGRGWGNDLIRIERVKERIIHDMYSHLRTKRPSQKGSCVIDHGLWESQYRHHVAQLPWNDSVKEEEKEKDPLASLVFPSSHHLTSSSFDSIPSEFTSLDPTSFSSNPTLTDTYFPSSMPSEAFEDEFSDHSSTTAREIEVEVDDCLLYEVEDGVYVRPSVGEEGEGHIPEASSSSHETKI
ncbi:hypothetical protein BJ684DRAFT_17069 [Piptocephalis cylindrospora]|uniref:Uncharacterized protein n=1 Tax=Piptocephalis cylindrospora TaxID=1907219 RepID=A0A4P9Y192_9FUNG|nr:hypothetical protein BJ684DRAFT_17069 [Piptocephalis cylindrospora]|eukprot:RKP12444.1 hypothetical protein BJ684DRAFT_17069 [Piptocephalis cylindrospora]